MSLDHWRKTTIGGTAPPIVPVTDEVSPDHNFKFLHRQILSVDPVVEQFTLQTGPHAFAFCIIMATSTSTIHTLNDAILG